LWMRIFLVFPAISGFSRVAVPHSNLKMFFFFGENYPPIHFIHVKMQ
jgi:hypothetical protein